MIRRPRIAWTLTALLALASPSASTSGSRLVGSRWWAAKATALLPGHAGWVGHAAVLGNSVLVGGLAGATLTSQWRMPASGSLVGFESPAWATRAFTVPDWVQAPWRAWSAVPETWMQWWLSTSIGRRRFEAERRVAELGLGTSLVGHQLLSGRVEDAWAAAAAEGVSSADGGYALAWPVRGGRFVRGFGSGAGAYHLAVDIHAPLGTEVLAAADGLVAYAGEELRGFGHALILVHPSGSATLYAHNAANLVAAGERVSAGQHIASLGSTGISRGPHVHFELLRDGRNCDPMPLFHHTDLGIGRRHVLQCASRRRFPGAVADPSDVEGSASDDADHSAGVVAERRSPTG